VIALSGVALAGCGKGARAVSPTGTGSAVLARGAVGVSTKNTTRVGGADPAADAAAVAVAVYPGLTPATRPQAVVLVDEHDWPGALAASALASAPLGAPLLYADGDQLPDVSKQALEAMRPLGAASLGGAQVIRIGTSAGVPDGYRTRDIPAEHDPARSAAAVERLLALAHTGAPRQAIVLAAEAPRALQMPAAGLAAESGTPIVLVSRAGVPAASAAVLKAMQRPTIYVIGAATLSKGTFAALARLGPVVHVAGASGSETGESTSPVENAVSVSRFQHGSFGWGVHEAGHGLVFANVARPLDGPAAASLSAHGDYGPLLLLENSASVPTALTHYLSDIEPGYTTAIPPVREVYNHGWLIGDEDAISALAQAEIDTLLEIAPRKTAEEPSSE
jgi:hypothetical protein